MLKQCTLILQILEHLAQSSVFSVQYKYVLIKWLIYSIIEQQQGDLMNSWHITYSIWRKISASPVFYHHGLHTYMCVHTYITFICMTYMYTYDTNVNVNVE